MNLKTIRALVAILESSSLGVLEISEEGMTIHLEKKDCGVSISPMPAGYAPDAQTNVPVAAPLPVQQESVSHAEGEVDFNRITEMKSPMVGVFYAAPSPDSASFVSMGAKVKKGDVVCIIEAMKLMNEITAERDGEIVDILVEDGQVVEYGQILFKIF